MAKGGTLCCLLSDLSYLSTHQDGSCLFIARGATLCRLLAVYLNYQQITNQDGSCLFIARGGDLLALALKVARGFPVYRKRRRQLTTTCYLCYQHVIPPYCPSVFKKILKKEGPPPRSDCKEQYLPNAVLITYVVMS